MSLEDQMREAENIAKRNAVTSALVQSGLAFLASITDVPVIQAIIQMAPPAWSAIQAVRLNTISTPEADRERLRLDAVTVHIAQSIVARCQAGEQIRDDGFFDATVPPRPKAQEIFEAVARSCIREPAERKIPYIANIYANVSFRRVSVDTAQTVLRQAEDKTWRHFCLISLLRRAEGRDVLNRFLALDPSKFDQQSEAAFLWDDLERLHGRASGILENTGDGVQLTRSGQLLADLAELDRIDEIELSGLRSMMMAHTARH